MNLPEFLSLREGDLVYFWPETAGEGERYLVQVLAIGQDVFAGDLIGSGSGNRQFSCKYMENKPPHSTSENCGKFFETHGPKWLTKTPEHSDMVVNYNRSLEE